ALALQCCQDVLLPFGSQHQVAFFCGFLHFFTCFTSNIVLTLPEYAVIIGFMHFIAPFCRLSILE
ncbi:MAG TPA: hypothetical protein VEC93_22575, partial [Anaerolineae bacterium]|nr:hypothetical protein [Anaerolineae bacterium]